MSETCNRYAREHNWDEWNRGEGLGMGYIKVLQNQSTDDTFTGHNWVVRRETNHTGWSLFKTEYVDGKEVGEIGYGVNGFRRATEAMRYADEVGK